jgi:DNA gyrase subunit B
MDINSRGYDESDIQSLDGINQIRMRPTIFIGSLGAKGVFRLFTEAYANVVDEFNASRCDKMRIVIDSNDHTIRVDDNGPGIPIGKLEDIMTRPFTGGKYTKNAYSIAVGLNGVGCKCITAASEIMTVDIYRDNKHAHAEFSKGKTLKIDILDCPNQDKTGTSIYFKPDITLLNNIDMHYAQYKNAIELCSYMNPGIRIYFKFDDKEHTFYQPNGVSQYFLDHFVTAKSLKTVSKHINISGKTSYINPHNSDVTVNMEFETYFTWADNVKQFMIESFVNGLQTHDGGTHEEGFNSAVTDAIKRYIQKKNILPKNSPFSIESNDIKETLVSVLSVKHSHPLYATQIKEECTNEDIRDFIKAEVSQKFAEWLELNSASAKRIVDLSIMSAKARYAASNARKAVKASAAVTNHSVLIGIPQYSPCRSRDPEKSELFIVEGDSAGGSAKSGGDGSFQAVYKLKGVPPNVYSTQDITKYLKGEGTVIGDLVKVFGCGLGQSFDASKLRFHTIIIMTDADPDGSHISSLLLGFIYSFLPELIDAGYIFLAHPPLFRIGFGKNKEIYIPTMGMYWKILDESVMKEFDICAINNGKGEIINNKDFYRQFLYHLRDYFTNIEVTGKQVNIHPELLEYILVNYNSVIKQKTFRVNNNSFERYYDDAENCNVIEGIYNNVFHKIELTPYMIQNCSKVLSQITQIRWSNIILKHKKLNITLGPGLYGISKAIDRIVKSSIDIKYFKGLGEMNPSQLWTTTMDPKTRTLTRVTMDMSKLAYYNSKLDIFIGNNIQGRKEYYRQYL